MDALFVRYAHPFSLIDGYIATGRFCDFIDSFSQRKIEDDRWDYYLHKVWDKSYEEFNRTMQNTQNLQALPQKTIEATIKKSMHILGNFNPEKG